MRVWVVLPKTLDDMRNLLYFPVLSAVQTGARGQDLEDDWTMAVGGHSLRLKHQPQSQHQTAHCAGTPNACLPLPGGQGP
jgi:hypothetical protein|mmetsp:Transcript_22053/g.37374  ORF Transcript_22053/g.37374 Transcript_22053/m.37374 type:complete len:80 (+) Transcript_22053:112-351(+)